MTPEELPDTTSLEGAQDVANPVTEPVDDFADVELGPPAQSCEIGCESCQ